MKNRYLLGVDLGTSSVKAVVIDQDGQYLANAAQEYSIDTPHPGWAEQDPNLWYSASVSAIRRAMQEAGREAADIEAVGLSGQMHGMVCMDEKGGILRPAIIWADQRSRLQVEAAVRQLGTERLGESTGNSLATGFMLSSWLWVREHEPEVALGTSVLLLPKDALRYRLTGKLGAEPSDACSTLMFDTAKREWSLPVLETLEIAPGLLPPIYPSSEIAGGLTHEAARDTGLLPGTPVVYGGGDQAMQALGNGLIDPGWLSCTIGTGGQLFAPMESPVYDPRLRVHSFCHVLPDRWYLMAATLSAGLSLKWLRDNLFRGSSYADLADQAAQAEDAEGLLFLPHLAGERTPYMDPGSKACFYGLTLRHHAGHMIRAVMEGVVFSLREGLEIIEGLGVSVEQIVASGGGINHPLWLQLMADIFNRPIRKTQAREAAATGAGLLAGIGAGIYPDAQAACRRAVRWSEQVVLPDPSRCAALEKKYRLFCQLYPALKSIQS